MSVLYFGLLCLDAHLHPVPILFLWAPGNQRPIKHKARPGLLVSSFMAWLIVFDVMVVDVTILAFFHHAFDPFLLPRAAHDLFQGFNQQRAEKGMVG